MFVYLVTRPGGDESADYDEFGGFVCIANNESDARNMTPYPKNHEYCYRDSWIEPEDAVVLCIGTAAAEITHGVVLASFHAG